MSERESEGFRGWVRGLKGKHTQHRERAREGVSEGEREREGGRPKKKEKPTEPPRCEVSWLLTCAHDSRGRVSIFFSSQITTVVCVFLLGQ